MRELWDETDQEVIIPLVDCKKVKAPAAYNSMRMSLGKWLPEKLMLLTHLIIVAVLLL